MSLLAQQSNISCKLSGLVMFQHNWTLDSLRLYIEYALNIFGSNFLVDKLNATFEQLVQTYIEIAKQSGLNQNELKQVFFL